MGTLEEEQKKVNSRGPVSGGAVRASGPFSVSVLLSCKGCFLTESDRNRHRGPGLIYM